MYYHSWILKRPPPYTDLYYRYNSIFFLSTNRMILRFISDFMGHGTFISLSRYRWEILSETFPYNMMCGTVPYCAQVSQAVLPIWNKPFSVWKRHGIVQWAVINLHGKVHILDTISLPTKAVTFSVVVQESFSCFHLHVTGSRWVHPYSGSCDRK